MNSLFSIVTPVYNVAEFLPAMFQSVLGQSCRCWEHIVVDDGSTDDSGAVLDSYASRDSRIRVLHQRNGGVSNARNSALRMATGQYIVFLDADDLLLENSLEMILKTFEQHPEVELVKYNHKCFTDGPDGESVMPEPEVSLVDIKNDLPLDFVMAPFWTYSIRRKSFHGIYFEPFCTGEDRLFIGMVLAHAHTVAVTNAVVYGYRSRTGSAMNSVVSKRKLLDRIGYSLQWLNVMTACGKRVGAGFYHMVLINLTESYIVGLHAIPHGDQKVVLEAWYGCLDVLRNYCSHFTCWGRFVVMLCSHVHSRLIADAVCYIPAYMKSIGLTRNRLFKR